MHDFKNKSFSWMDRQGHEAYWEMQKTKSVYIVLSTLTFTLKKTVYKLNSGHDFNTKAMVFEQKTGAKKKKREKIWKVLGSATEWVGRGSIGCSTTQVKFSAYQKSYLRCFFGWLGPKN